MTNNKTKLALSPKEQELVCNTDWILTKQTITEKIVELFSALLVSMQQVTSAKKTIYLRKYLQQIPKFRKEKTIKDFPM